VAGHVGKCLPESLLVRFGALVATFGKESASTLDEFSPLDEAIRTSKAPEDVILYPLFIESFSAILALRVFFFK